MLIRKVALKKVKKLILNLRDFTGKKLYFANKWPAV